MKPNRLPWTVVIVLLTFSPAAMAYLDPGTGSMLISAIVGLLASLALAIKTYWYKFVGMIRQLLGRGGSRNSGDETATGQSDDHNH